MDSEIPFWYYLSAIALYCLWGCILFFGIRRPSASGEAGRLFFKFPLFYSYLLFSIVINLSRFILANSVGPGTSIYFNFFYPTRYLIFGLAIAIILKIYWMAGRGSRRDYAPLLILPGFILVESLRIPDSHYYIKLSNALLCFEAVLGLLTYMRLFTNRRLKLGSNLGGILAGLYFPCLIAWFNHTLYLFGDLIGADLPYSLFASAMEPIGLLSWLLIALAMRRYDPPRWEDPPKPDLDEEVDEVFGEAIGAMRRMV